MLQEMPVMSSGGGGSNITAEGYTLTASVPLRLKTQNCVVILFSTSDTQDPLTSPVANNGYWSCVHEKVLSSPTTWYYTATYDATTEILSITSTQDSQRRLLIFGDYEILT